MVKSIPVVSVETVPHKSLTRDHCKGFDEGLGEKPPARSRYFKIEKKRCLRKQPEMLPMSNRPATAI
jgi:hypothetical protein